MTLSSTTLGSRRFASARVLGRAQPRVAAAARRPVVVARAEKVSGVCVCVCAPPTLSLEA